MTIRDQPRIVRDATGREKLKVSLPGGRYQLSLDDRGVNLLFDRIGYGLRDTVPDTVVRVLLATGDAWFPHQRDYESVIEDLPSTKEILDSELDHLADFLRTIHVRESRYSAVQKVVQETPLAGELEADEVTVRDLPTPPEEIFGEVSFETGSTEARGNDAEPQSTDGPPQQTDEPTPETAVRQIATESSGSAGDIQERLDRLLDVGATPETAVETLERQFGSGGPDVDVFDIPGVGTIRGHKLLRSGYDEVQGLADARPVDLAGSSNVSEEIATVVIEGARELTGRRQSTAAQLARQTNVPEERFESALSMLAAAGVPPSAAAPRLREVIGPSITRVQRVDDRMAFFLFEAGYRTPWDIAQATPAELEAVDYLGPTTAEQVVEDAENLLNS